MTTKEAAERFHLSLKEIQKLCNEGKIPGAEKRGKSYYIPDDTLIIVTDKEVCDFTRLLLQYKNNTRMIFPVRGLETVQKRRIWYDYLIREGIIGNCEFFENLNEMLDSMQLTDKGLGMAFRNSNTRFEVKTPFNLNINVACMNVG